MKVIYNNVNFLHLNENFPRKKFSVFFDEIQHDINVESLESKINIPIKQYEKVSFPRQFSRYVSTGNPRRLLPEDEELYEELEIKIKNHVVYYETGNLRDYSKLIFLFAESDEYEITLEEVLKNNIKEDTKLLVFKDEYLQKGSNFLFKNNNESLIDNITAIMEREMRKLDIEDVVIMGARSGAQAAKVYGSFFEETTLITFNSDYKVMKTPEELHLLQYEGIKLRKSIEITSFLEETLESEQYNEDELIVNTRSYSFEEMMKFTIFFAYSFIGKKERSENENFVMDEVDQRFEIRNNLKHRPQIVLQRINGISSHLRVFSHGPINYILKDDVIKEKVESEIIFITQDEILKATGIVNFE